MTAAILDGGNVEITTLRKDVETDGRRATIAFATDRGPGTDFNTLAIGNFRIALYDLADGSVRVLDGIRPWLQVLLAISANSPYWHGRDTGFASWRSQLWSRWPSRPSCP